MEREPASDIITGAGSRRPRIDATGFHIQRKRLQNKRLAVLGGRAKAKKPRRARITNTQKQSTRPMKRSKLMMTPIAKERQKPTMPFVELKPKIMPKPRPRPRIPSVPDADPLEILVIDLTVDPHCSYRVMDLTGV